MVLARTAETLDTLALKRAILWITGALGGTRTRKAEADVVVARCVYRFRH